MKEIFHRNLTVYELDYTDDFIAVLDIQTTDDDFLRGDVIIEDKNSDSRLVVGTCMSRDARASVDEIKAYCLNLIKNEDYCKSAFENICEL